MLVFSLHKTDSVRAKQHFLFGIPVFKELISSDLRAVTEEGD